MLAGAVLGQPPQADEKAITPPVPRRTGTTNSVPVAKVPDKITLGNVKLEGVAVQVIKAPNPLQLINPFAPPEYGSGYRNVVYGSMPGKVIGVKVLAVTF